MEREWDDSSPVVISANNSIQSASFQNSSFQRRGNNRGRFNRSDGGGGGDGRGGGRGRFNNRRMGNGNSFNNPGRSGDAKIIKIPSKFVGRVIGKGGSKINDLQFESGAKIIVTKDQEENETMVKLIGTDDEVTKAEGLIRELTVERDYSSQNQAPHNFVYEELAEDGRPPIPVIDWKAAAEASVSLFKNNLV
ncbi:K Homology domain containing protein [Oryctes borbonicus]|uniref:K Homology domain containing protein n=1 Tax=Oryctes borbonicus TaxID=1629725 RepID=A0A0T6BH36_9SCAR|nr:K Homology domain containing protein [Oryctes borbonicus]